LRIRGSIAAGVAQGLRFASRLCRPWQAVHLQLGPEGMGGKIRKNRHFVLRECHTSRKAAIFAPSAIHSGGSVVPLRSGAGRKRGGAFITSCPADISPCESFQRGGLFSGFPEGRRLAGFAPLEKSRPWYGRYSIEVGAFSLCRPVAAEGPWPSATARISSKVGTSRSDPHACCASRRQAGEGKSQPGSVDGRRKTLGATRGRNGVGGEGPGRGVQLGKKGRFALAVSPCRSIILKTENAMARKTDEKSRGCRRGGTTPKGARRRAAPTPVPLTRKIEMPNPSPGQDRVPYLRG